MDPEPSAYDIISFFTNRLPTPVNDIDSETGLLVSHRDRNNIRAILLSRECNRVYEYFSSIRETNKDSKISMKYFAVAFIYAYASLTHLVDWSSGKVVELYFKTFEPHVHIGTYIVSRRGEIIDERTPDFKSFSSNVDNCLEFLLSPIQDGRNISILFETIVGGNKFKDNQEIKKSRNQEIKKSRQSNKSRKNKSRRNKSRKNKSRRRRRQR